MVHLVKDKTNDATIKGCDIKCRVTFDILEKAHVGVAPGIDFGNNAEGYLRFSYANSLENIEEGMERLEKYLEKRA